jgi:hypothetical protein
MKPVALHSSLSLRTTCGILLAIALALVPASTFAQHGGAAGAHAAGARPSGVRSPEAPAVRSAGAGTGVNHPAVVSPLIARPIISRPAGIPLTPFRGSPEPYRAVFPTLPPRRFPPTPIVPMNPFLRTGFFGLGYSGLFPCGSGLGYGCGMLLPYYAYGSAYPPGGVYPSGPSGYPSEPDYSPVDPSASLQYSPLPNEYPSLESLPAENSTASGSGSGQLRSETLLYFTDGSVFAVASYTVSNGKLHYVTAYGEESDVDVALLDVQKTINANAASGVTFTLTPPPSSAPGAAAPDPPSPSPAPPGPINPPKP